MGDQTDGSSRAAPGAQSETPEKPRGFFERLFGRGEAHDAQVGTSLNGLAPPTPQAVGMVNLRRMRLEDVLVPKAEVVAVPDDIERDELVAVFRDSGLTRIPVYKGTLDTPMGFVHLKDFALKHGFNGSGGDYKMADLLRPLIYAPPSMGIGVLLQRMQNSRIHIALVIDEYGGVDGLVTIEDLIEQVIGEIEDEHDPEEGRLWTLEKPGCYLVQPRAPLDEFEAEIGFRLSDDETDEEIDSVGGLVFLLSGRVPVRGEVIPHPTGTEFEVVDADPRRIKRLRVRLPQSGDG